VANKKKVTSEHRNCVLKDSSCCGGKLWIFSMINITIYRILGELESVLDDSSHTFSHY
jgi:hypothetical protein